MHRHLGSCVYNNNNGHFGARPTVHCSGYVLYWGIIVTMKHCKYRLYGAHAYVVRIMSEIGFYLHPNIARDVWQWQLVGVVRASPTHTVRYSAGSVSAVLSVHCLEIRNVRYLGVLNVLYVAIVNFAET